MCFAECPRCGDEAFEILETHSFCVSCNYSPDFDEIPEPIIPNWALEAMDEQSDEIENKNLVSLEELESEEEELAESA